MSATYRQRRWQCTGWNADANSQGPRHGRGAVVPDGEAQFTGGALHAQPAAKGGRQFPEVDQPPRACFLPPIEPAAHPARAFGGRLVVVEVPDHRKAGREPNTVGPVQIGGADVRGPAEPVVMTDSQVVAG